jgi:hypothetical protein
MVKYNFNFAFVDTNFHLNIFWLYSQEQFFLNFIPNNALHNMREEANMA